jgi:hypothetical protein
MVTFRFLTFLELYSASLWDETFGDEEYELTCCMEQVGKTMPELYSLTSAATARRSVVLNKNFFRG